jgi:hypothetical protein
VKRRLFNVLAGVSLVLCVVTAALRARSTRYLDAGYILLTPSVKLSLLSQQGHVWCSIVNGSNSLLKRYGVGGRPLSSGIETVEPVRPNLFGFAPYSRGPVRGILIQYGVFLILFAAAPLAWIMAHRNRFRGPGFCPLCGYDLRATPDRCPECGSPAQPKPAAAIATSPANSIER